MDFTLTTHGHPVRFFLGSASVQAAGDLEARKRRMQSALELLPREHVRTIVEPIIVVDRFPGGRRTGGGWFPPGRVQSWLSSGGVRNSGVPAAEVQARVGAGVGIIGITSHSFLKDENWGGGHLAYEFTLLHEIAHAVDHHSGLIPPTALPGRYGNGPYQGQRYPGGSVEEMAAEAYSRFFLRRSSMCRGGKGTPPCLGPNGSPARSGERCPTQRQCSERLQRDLAATRAFAGLNIAIASADVSGEGEPRRVPSAPSPFLRDPAMRGPDGMRSRGWRRPGPTCYSDNFHLDLLEDPARSGFAACEF